MSLKSSVLRELAYGPQTVKKLKERVGVDGKKIVKTLKGLISSGEVEHRKGVYTLKTVSAGIFEGTLVKLGKSFGFVAPLDGSGDIFIPGHSLNGALPQDVVQVSLSATPRVAGSREGEVLAIVHPNDRIAGTVRRIEGRLALVPDNAPNTPLYIKKSADGGVKEGEKAAGQILERGEHHGDIRVGIIQRFGSAESARQCAKAILFAAGVEKSFPEGVKAEAKTVSCEAITKEIIKSRTDFRDEPIFTIDSESTKDIDDAISAYKTDYGYKLCVHIADVSHYVRAKSAVDENALSRGTSIYYADSVIPMLPRSLSNGACSLNPNEDRLAFSCVMELDHNGSLLDYHFAKSVICSRVKGVYSEINLILAGQQDEKLAAKYSCVEGSIAVMKELYHKLAALRNARGSMEIESDEPSLILDDEGRCVNVEKRSRGDAERMIEEFMLMANTSAAHLARRKQLPFVYRVHDKPGAEKVDNLKRVLTAAGVDYHFDEDIPNQKELSALLEEYRHSPLQVPVHNAVLRSMAKAKYEPVPKGHYGLALADYAHFTSPIRRYPDLAIHRILSDYVAGVPYDTLTKRYGNFVNIASSQSSERELISTKIERDCDDCYKAEYMKQFIGQSFEGVITSVVSYGIYVGLDNTVEGLVHISHLSDRPLELTEGVCLADPRTGNSFRLGDAIRVVVAGVDVSQGNIDFVPEQSGTP